MFVVVVEAVAAPPLIDLLQSFVVVISGLAVHVCRMSILGGATGFCVVKFKQKDLPVLSFVVALLFICAGRTGTSPVYASVLRCCSWRWSLVPTAGTAAA